MGTADDEEGYVDCAACGRPVTDEDPERPLVHLPDGVSGHSENGSVFCDQDHQDTSTVALRPQEGLLTQVRALQGDDADFVWARAERSHKEWGWSVERAFTEALRALRDGPRLDSTLDPISPDFDARKGVGR